MVKFQKRHYEVVAKTLNDLHLSISDKDRDIVISAFIQVFKHDNDLFKQARFYEACTRRVNNAL